jgi:hypothetical protein
MILDGSGKSMKRKKTITWVAVSGISFVLTRNECAASGLGSAFNANVSSFNVLGISNLN